MFKLAIAPLMVAGLVAGAFAGDFAEEADPSKVFVGVELSGALVQGSHKTNLNYSSKGFGYGIRLGAQNSEWRTMLTFDRMNNKKVSYERGEVHAQYLFSTAQMVHPFIGINGGYANYEAEGPDATGKAINESDFVYGAEAGLVFDLSDNIDIDLTYKYSIGQAKAFDHANNLAVGINYKY